MSTTIKTRLHVFYFDIKNAEEKAAWLALRESLKSGPREMESHGGASHTLGLTPGVYEIEVETANVFDNQWNTSDTQGKILKRRVFDFAFDYKPTNNPFIKRGHWIEQTAEMIAVRENTMACGYCGKQEPAQKGHVFCPHCLDSEYLKESDIFLTRMLPAGRSFGGQRAPLTEAESAYLLPLYRAAQLHGSTDRGRARIAKKRTDLIQSKEKAIRIAETEFSGFTWLMDHGINTENCIYYNHKDIFSFGWRQPLSNEIVSGLLDLIGEFPHRYEITCADGRILTNAE